MLRTVLQTFGRKNVRQFASRMPRVPPSQFFPGFDPNLPPVDFKYSGYQVTTLPNGVRVASEDNLGPGTTVGVLIDTGSRYEDPNNSGISHFMERLAFKSTKNRSAAELTNQLTSLGGSARTMLSREHLMATVDCLRTDAPDVVEICADIVRNPAFLPEDFEDVQQYFEQEIELRGKNSEQVMEDACHRTAFGGAGLGSPLNASHTTLKKVNLGLLRDWHSKFYVGPRVIVAAAGMDHQQLVQLAQTHFGSLPDSSNRPVVKHVSPYKGGFHQFQHLEHEWGMTHLMMGWEAPHWNHDDLIPACVLQMMMGGGGSFSSGGPGKGMYSRMYLNVLNRYNFVHHANTHIYPYSDAGLFVMYGQAPPDGIPHLARVLGREAINMTQLPTASELDRAKTQLMSTIQMNMESRSLQFEDMATQLLLTNKRSSIEEMTHRIRSITRESLAEVARKIVSAPLTVVVSGENLQGVPSMDYFNGCVRK
eukprot:TRINITY_DN3957_c0_g1_i2.p1 TRINITY_DN3957_c0_g1~~TRINITY_DN3957_c0_g1_i2.p1  ORF type:complete len:479 (+),score=68.31 TRINITY_DN3957_c0_g1_i2:64-1500(+)